MLLKKCDFSGVGWVRTSCSPPPLDSRMYKMSAGTDIVIATSMYPATDATRKE